MAKSILDEFLTKAKNSSKRIVLPEGEDERIICAIKQAVQKKLGHIIVLGDVNIIGAKLGKEVTSKVEIINPLNEPQRIEKFSQRLYELRKHKGMTPELAEREVIHNKMMFATMMLEMGEADGIVAGVITHTADVLRPALQLIKTEEGVSKVSSVMLMQMPSNSLYGEKGVLMFADPSIIPEPESSDLADIAIATAKTARRLLNIEPKVAMLSFSTASTKDTGIESVEKVKRATEIAKTKCPNLVIEGEVQADAAIVPEVAKLKCPNSVLKGKANVLVFPDLNSANISYKLVQRIAGIPAIGPILQGLKKPVNDLSRGATADEIVSVIAVTILQCL